MGASSLRRSSGRRGGPHSSTSSQAGDRPAAPELRRLSSIYPEFADRVEFYGIGIDPSETPDELEDLKAREGYVYDIAFPVGKAIADLRILKQSSKIAIAGDGVIAYRAGFGGGDMDEWAQILSGLADTRTAPVSAPAAAPTQPAQVAGRCAHGHGHRSSPADAYARPAADRHTCAHLHGNAYSNSGCIRYQVRSRWPRPQLLGF